MAAPTSLELRQVLRLLRSSDIASLGRNPRQRFAHESRSSSAHSGSIQLADAQTGSLFFHLLKETPYRRHLLPRQCEDVCRLFPAPPKSFHPRTPRRAECCEFLFAEFPHPGRRCLGSTVEIAE